MTANDRAPSVPGSENTHITMKRHLPAALLSLLLVFALAAQAPDDELPSLDSQVDELFAEWDKTSSPGCALGVYRDGGIAYARGYGMANLEYGIASSPQSIFRIGSTSKQFTAMAVALLAEEGKLSLDDDVRKFFPELPDYGRTITVRHLIHHTSGIRDYLTLAGLVGWGEDFSIAEALGIVARQKTLNFEPGEKFLYSNSNYFLMALLVERVTGETLREWAEEHIFKVLGMSNTHFHDDHTHIVRNRADGYSPGDGGYTIDMTILDMVGDGGILTSVEDLLLWDRNFYDNKLGKARRELIDEITTPGHLNDGEALDYAFGLEVGEHRSLKRIEHGGGFVGFRAQMIRFPEQHFSVAVLCNLGSIDPTPLAYRVAELYLAEVMEPAAEDEASGERPPAAVTLSEKDLGRLSGHYWNPERKAARRIYREQDKLHIDWDGDLRAELQPLGGDRFAMVGFPVEAEVHFEPAGARRPERMVVLVRSERRVLEPYEKKTLPPAKLGRYAGSYLSAELDARYTVELADEGLMLRAPRLDPRPLEPQFDETFTAMGEFESISVEFERDRQGKVVAFLLHAGRARAFSFVKE
ncbi:MAG: serine hydrolase [bacterium]|nr:serine hydrolase [bacterium]